MAVVEHDDGLSDGCGYVSYVWHKGLQFVLCVKIVTPLRRWCVKPISIEAVETEIADISCCGWVVGHETFKLWFIYDAIPDMVFS